MYLKFLLAITTALFCSNDKRKVGTGSPIVCVYLPVKDDVKECVPHYLAAHRQSDQLNAGGMQCMCCRVGELVEAPVKVREWRRVLTGYW